MKPAKVLVYAVLLGLLAFGTVVVWKELKHRREIDAAAESRTNPELHK